MSIQQVPVEYIGQCLDTGRILRIFNTEFVAHGRDEFRGCHLRIEHHGDIHVDGYLLHQAAADGGLAGTDFTRQLNKAAALPQAIQQVRQCLAVAGAHIEKPRVRCNRERLLGKIEMVQVHGCFVCLGQQVICRVAFVSLETLYFKALLRRPPDSHTP